MCQQVKEDMIHIQNILNGNKESEIALYEKYRIIVGDFIKCKYFNYCYHYNFFL
jgi:hypothetical protein